MRYHELTEAPISIDNHVAGRGESFDDDVAVKWAQSPKAQMKVIRAFQRVPFNIKLILANFSFRHIGVMEMQDLAEAQQQLPDLRPDPQAITFLLTGNWLGRHPLSPWMVAHRFGHGIQGTSTPDSLPDIAFDYPKFFDWVAPVKARYIELHGYVSFDNFGNVLGTMRSARTNQVRDLAEFMHEVLAQYLLTGQIKFNPIAGMTDELEDLRRKFVAAIEQTMQQLIGKIVVM